MKLLCTCGPPPLSFTFLPPSPLPSLPPLALHVLCSPEAALDHFAMKRFYDDKLMGVTQPSQRRYVHYFADLLAGKISLDSP